MADITETTILEAWSLSQDIITHLNVNLSVILKWVAETWLYDSPDSKVHGAYMGPTWGWQDPGGPHVGPMNLAIWEGILGMTNYFIKWSGIEPVSKSHIFRGKPGNINKQTMIQCTGVKREEKQCWHLAISQLTPPGENRVRQFVKLMWLIFGCQQLYFIMGFHAQLTVSL